MGVKVTSERHFTSVNTEALQFRIWCCVRGRTAHGAAQNTAEAMTSW